MCLFVLFVLFIYPVQLIESGVALILCLLLTLNFKFLSRYKHGLVCTLGILSYCVLRFVLEYFRDDFRGWIIEGKLSSSQGLSLLIGLFLILESSIKIQRSSH